MSNLNKKILVVDDDAVVLKAISMQLKCSGYDVISASDGTKAVTAARAEKPAAIVLDLNFPDDFGSVAWDGYRIMEWLNRLDNGQKMPVIVMSSSDSSKVEARVRELGAAAFFQKPINTAELVGEIQRLLATEVVASN